MKQFSFIVPALCLLIVTFALGGCSKKAEEEFKPETPAAIPQLPDDTRPVILCFGDSITAGFGLEAGETFPDRLQTILDKQGYKYRVLNAGISGDTTESGVERLGDALKFEPKVTLLELGGNDGLRGIAIGRTRDNLTQIAGRIEAKGGKVLLLGITLPRNYGRDYIQEFEAMYKTLAKGHNYALMPFVLEGVYGTAGGMQADGIHPTASGAASIAGNIFQYLKPLLSK